MVFSVLVLTPLLWYCPKKSNSWDYRKQLEDWFCKFTTKALEWPTNYASTNYILKLYSRTFEVSKMLATQLHDLILVSFIFVEVMFFKISKNKIYPLYSTLKVLYVTYQNDSCGDTKTRLHMPYFIIIILNSQIAFVIT